MKSLPSLSIKSWDNTEQVFSLVAWSEREEKILLLDADRSPRILKLCLPQLDQKGWHYGGNPYPDAEPVRMEAIRLICPPCRGNAREAAKVSTPMDPGPFRLQSAGSSTCEWEKAWVQCGDEILWPGQDDAPALRALGEQLMPRKQAEYESRKQKLATLTQVEFQYLQITKQVGGIWALLPASPETFRRYVREEGFHLDFEISQPLSETTIGHGDTSSLTSRLRIEQEYSDLVCSYLCEKWARNHNLDLAAMEQDRLRFMEFVRKHATNVMESVSPAFDSRNLFSGQKRESTAQRPALQLAPQKELVLCAKVRHVLTFSDGSRVWLAPSRLRPPHTTEEHDFDTCLGVGETGRLEAVIPKLAGERQKLEAERIELAERTKDLRETLGKVPEAFADPLVVAAKDASVKRGVPHEFAWWVFQERHFDKFPTVDGAFRRCGLGRKLRRDGFAFSRATLGRWLKIISEELDQRKLLSRRCRGRRAFKSTDFEIAQTKEPDQQSGNADEPPEAFVQWVENQDAAGKMPTEKDVLTHVGDHAGRFGLVSYSDDQLKVVAKRWLKKAVEILDEVQSGPVERDNDLDRRDGE